MLHGHACLGLKERPDDLRNSINGARDGGHLVVIAAAIITVTIDAAAGF